MKYIITEILEGGAEERRGGALPNIQEAIAWMVSWQYHNPGKSYRIREYKS